MIGGTRFLGRNLVEEALHRSQDVRILQRGKTNAQLFPEIKKYTGDRLDIKKLIDPRETFDVVIDTCGYHPEVVRESCEFLCGKTQLYIFISTCSVYKNPSIIGQNESAEIATLDVIPSRTETGKMETYGPLKALCEQEVLKFFGPEKSLILRPCIIVGKYDDTNRFNSIISSVQNNKELEIPDDDEAKIQFIDVRSIVNFIFEASEKNIRGIFNTVGPEVPVALMDFLKQAKNLLNPELKFKRVNRENIQFPLYVPDEDWKGFFTFKGERAFAHGMTAYSVEDTIQYVANCTRCHAS